MKNFFRRLIGDKTWYSLFEYESLPTYQALCLESKKLLDIQDRLISKLTDNNLDEFEDQNDQKLYDSTQDNIFKIHEKRCRVEGKIVTNRYSFLGPPGNNCLCAVTMAIPSNGPGVPSTLTFSITRKEHGLSQIEYAIRLKEGQAIRLHGAFSFESLCSGSGYGMHDHQIVIFDP